MSKTQISIVILLILIQSCTTRDYDVAKFEILNDSDSSIDSLYITHHQKDEINTKKIYTFKPHQSINIDIVMRNAGGDGSYTINYKMDGKWYSERYGYYTNGSQMEELITIKIIKADSLSIDSFFNKNLY